MRPQSQNPCDPIRTSALIAVVGLVLAAVAMAAAVREQDHRNEVASGWSEATANVMAHLAERSLQSITLSLDEIADDIKAASYFRRPPGDWLNRHFSAAADALPQIVAILLTDDRGAVSVSWYDGANGPPADLSDRDYVGVWLDGLEADHYVSQPLRTRVIGDWWYFAVSRPVRDANGALIGVLAGLVSVDYFEALYREPIKVPGEAVALANGAGQLLVTAGSDLSPGDTLPDAAAALLGRQDATPTVARVDSGGEAMFVSVRTLSPYGLSVVALSPRATLAEAMIGPGITWASLWAMAIALILLNARHQARQRNDQRVIEQHARALEAVARDLQAAKGRAEQACIEAEAANQAKSRFLALMSHELRTPLNAILGFAELIRDPPFAGSDASHHAEYAEDIHASGRHLLDLINDILDLAKIDSGRLDLDPQPVDLRALLAEVQTVVGPRGATKGVRIAVAVEAQLAGIVADRRGMKQILLNLVDNAVKAMHHAGTVEAQAHLRPEGTVEIAVVDSGIGIPPERLDSLFQPFEQVDNRYAKSDYGVGLGLVLVKRLTELHNGTLTVESRPGEGTRVSVILPRERAILSVGQAARSACPPPSATAAA